MINIVAIPAFKDNYIWGLHSPDNDTMVVVDPGEAQPVLNYLNQNHLKLEAILITHHHWDHSGGIAALCEHFPSIPVYGSSYEACEGITHPLSDGDTLTLSVVAKPFRVMAIPGHTLGHIAYYGNDALFCGDTLFSMGCGRIFEGTPVQLLNSLNKLKCLPESTRVYCGHEYTLTNIQFAKTIEPHNAALLQYEREATVLRQSNKPSLPSHIAIERLANPFLRCDHPDVIEAVCRLSGCLRQDALTIFTALRELKDNFKI